MKQWIASEFGAIADVLQCVAAQPLENPAAGIMTLKVLAAGVGLPDALMVKGQYPLVLQSPASPGQEVVGIVEEVGEGVSFSIGDRVMGTSLFTKASGSFAQYCYASSRMATKVPESMSDEDAAGFVMRLQTAHVGLVQRCNLKAGETLLVLGGAGSSGSGAIQLGKALGANVVATVSSQEKAEFCYSLGADSVINYRQGPIADQVKKVAGSVDVVFDPVGGDAFTEATKCIGLHGRIALIGFSSGSWPQINPVDMVKKSYSVIGAFLGCCSAQEVETAYRDLLSFYEQGFLRTPIASVYPFSQVPDAIKAIEEQNTLGKLIVSVSN